jgi:hypothetical protein
VRWNVDGNGNQAEVPVIDEFGRVAATILPQIGIDEAWDQLANFPMPPNDEDIPPEGDGEIADGPPQGQLGGSFAAAYPLRRMMQLIENIAAKQTSVSRADWRLWCTRLEQCLTQAATSTVIEVFVKLGLNPLSPLRHQAFRPDFAADAGTGEALLYEDTLKRVEKSWQVADLSGIGGQA